MDSSAIKLVHPTLVSEGNQEGVIRTTNRKQIIVLNTLFYT